MRIRVINPFGGTEFRGRENLERIRRSGTEFDMVNIADAYPLKNNQFLYFRQMCTDATLEQVIQAEKDGCDAVFIFLQPGHRTLRSAFPGGHPDHGHAGVGGSDGVRHV